MLCGRSTADYVHPLFTERTGLDPHASPSGGEDFQTHLIMPEPTIFLSRKFPPVSIIRPTEPGGSGGAVATVKAWTADGLFIGQSQDFLAFLRKLAVQADETRRG